MTFKTARPVVRQTKRTDAILHLKQKYSGDLHSAEPLAWNRAFADVLRTLADSLEGIDNAYADPEVVVWMGVPEGTISAELSLSDPVTPKKRKRRSRKRR